MCCVRGGIGADVCYCFLILLTTVAFSNERTTGMSPLNNDSFCMCMGVHVYVLVTLSLFVFLD